MPPEMSLEDLKKELETPYDQMQDGYMETPVKEFIGDLDNYEPEVRNDKVSIRLEFASIKVIDSVEPYPYDTVMFHVPHSKQKSSMEGKLKSSIFALNKQGTLSSVLKQRLHMKLEAVNFGKWRQTDTEDNIRNTWLLKEIIGAAPAGKSGYDVALELAVGKNINNLAAYWQEAFMNPVIKNDKETFQKILSKKLIQEALDIGVLKTDATGTISMGLPE